MKILGTAFFVIGIAILLFIFGPVIKAELKYQSDRLGAVRYSLDEDPEFPRPGIKPLKPVDTEFGIVIPKINLNAEVFPNVDPANPDVYLPILKKGVAHAKGSSLPDMVGNVYLFAHSTDAFYNVGQYNAVFFLIGKLEAGDEVDLFFDGKRYLYKVVEKAVVAPEGLSQYVKEHSGQNTLTLQTCYPPGTTLKRLIVIAQKEK